MSEPTGQELVVADTSILARRHPMTADLVLENMARVKQIQESVMKKDAHYGIVPGCKKPSLYQAGAEQLLFTFRQVAVFDIEDLSTPGIIRYRVKCTIRFIFDPDSIVAEEWGECSSEEEKYAWRRATCKSEFNATPADMRRVKWTTYQNKEQSTDQVRTNPADVANTILAMACKRAKVRATRAANAASDVFDVNTEDIPREIRESINEDEEDRPEISEALNRRQNPGQASTPAAPRRIGYRVVLMVLRDLGLTEGTGDDEKPSRAGFHLVGKCGKARSWREWTPADYLDVYQYLNSQEAVNRAAELLAEEKAAQAAPAAETTSDPTADITQPPAYDMQSGMTVITFGKHKGLRICDVPEDYVQWLAEKSTSPEIKEAAYNYLHGEMPPPSDTSDLLDAYEKERAEATDELPDITDPFANE